MKQRITTAVAVLFVAGFTQAGILASQDFDAEIFSSGAESGSTYFNRTDGAPVTHASTGGTDLGFTHDGLVSTFEDGAAGVAGGEFRITHYSSTYTGSALDFGGNPRTGAFHFESVSFPVGSSGKTFSMDIRDIGTNTDDDDVVVRLLVNGATTVTLLDTRSQANGTAGTQTLTHNFADTDTSSQLLIDVLSDDPGDGYGFDTIEFTINDGLAAVWTTNSMTSSVTGIVGRAYSDPEALFEKAEGDAPVEYSLAASAPNWLGVASDGSISNTRALVSGDIGMNMFNVVCSNAIGSSTGLLSIVVLADLPPVWDTPLPINGGSAFPDGEYAGSLKNTASDPYGGDVEYSKTTGSDWLTVDPDGGMSGTAPGTAGTNTFSVVATTLGGSTNAMMYIVVKNETIIKSQNFNAEIFTTGSESGTLYFNGTVAHASAGGTDLGFNHNGMVSTTAGGIAGVVGGEFHTVHYSSTYSGSSLDFGNPRTGALHFDEVVFTVGSSGKNFSMDIHDIGTNTDNDDVVVRLLVNGTTEVLLLDTRPQTNGTVIDGIATGSRTLTHNFAGTDTSAQLLIDVLSDDPVDGYGFDNIVFAGLFNPDAPTFNTNPIASADGRATVVYTGDMGSMASDPNNDPLEFGKESGPDWLTVAPDGTLGGTPATSDMGLNPFIVSVTDNKDGLDFAQLTIQINDPDGIPPPTDSRTEHYRLIWDDDPTSNITVAWKQISGANGTVYYGTEDFGRTYTNYPSHKSVDRTGTFITNGTINSCFAYLSDLQPDTAYYFVIKDDAGVSPRFWFLTAPDSPKPFTFVAGGDSRTNYDPRRKANRMVAKLRSLFVIFTGDMIGINDVNAWNIWFDHWQETISKDGRIYPLIPHRGNHEGYFASSNNAFYQLFDTTENNYYSFSVGGNLLRFYVLNSEMDDNETLWNAQTTWLENDLAANAASHTHLSAGYHKPMRPHTSTKAEGINEYNAWAQHFYDHGMDLVFESDSHTTKRTWAIKPFTGTGSDEGFIRDDANGTVFAGEGCWGAPLRDPDDAKSWTRAVGKFNSFSWVHVYPSYMELFTIKVDNSDDVGNLQEGDVFSLPSAIEPWAPTNGTRMVINNQNATELKSYAQWQLDQWGGGAIPAHTEALADFDGDGYNNMTEFSYGLDPQIPETAGAGVLPVIAVGGLDQIGISYRRKTNTSLSYLYEFSGDLVAWIPMVAGVDYSETLTTEGSNEQVEIELLDDKATAAKGFIRIWLGIQ